MNNRQIASSERIVNPDGTPHPQFLTKFNQLAPPKYTVAKLPTNAVQGQPAYATDLCVFNGAGTQETTGNGSGGNVTFNGTNWVIAGTNVTASA